MVEKGVAKDLPHDLLAEKSLLSCLIIDGTAFDEISDLGLKRDDFFHPQYGVIFEAIWEIYHARQPIDYVMVCSRLSDKGQIDQVGGKDAVLEIVDEQASSANVYQYGKIVRDKSKIREIVKTANRVAEQGISYAGDVDSLMSSIEAQMFRITNDARSGKMMRLSECLKANLKELEDTSRKPGEISGLPTGYADLDKLLLGLQPGQLIILAARPAMGKTAFALNIASKCCGLSRFPVAIFSLEMTHNELSMRMLSSKAKVDSRKFKVKDFLDQDLHSISWAFKEMAQYPIYINDDSSSTLFDIQSQCRKIKAEQGLGLVIIDYLQLMRSHSNNPNRVEQVSEISRGLKGMAKELSCPVIALSQLNRSLESRTDKRPNPADLRESGSIEQDADIVMFIYRDEVYNPETKKPGIAEIIIAKNRSGPTDTVELAWVAPYTSFESLHKDGHVVKNKGQ